jgi:hypothetical protein
LFDNGTTRRFVKNNLLVPERKKQKRQKRSYKVYNVYVCIWLFCACKIDICVVQICTEIENCTCQKSVIIGIAFFRYR